MPYIPPQRRQDLLGPAFAETAGELNYRLTKMLIEYVETLGLSYETLNAAVGALESAKVEFQRRIVAPYEEDARRRNGDVYPRAMTFSRRADP